ncbi:protein kinase [Nonomuraea sp. NPDC049309]|uniref:protein kinase domain-containing protein n=1 Tax=Nonomuraea sp. NPDC049309 TaxID=3364350 RepID=UPI003719527B
MPDMRPLRPADPERVGGYRLLGVLGSGGQGTVYRGVGDQGREVAVKLLHSHLAQDGDVKRGFLREVEAARRVAAFCTAAVLDVGVMDDRPYIVSEYVPGDTLLTVVRTSGPRTGGALHRLAIATLTALAAIHQAEIVHRDFKPGNVLMGPDGPVVIDFGIAKALDATSATSGAVGTPAYMSPEQFRGERVGPASDMFSWAGTMVFAATGHPPFRGEAMAVIMNRILSGEPGLDGVPASLRGLIEACLAKDPAARPSPADLLTTLIRPAASSPHSSPPAANDAPPAPGPSGQVPASGPHPAAPPIGAGASPPRGPGPSGPPIGLGRSPAHEPAPSGPPIGLGASPAHEPAPSGPPIGLGASPAHGPGSSGPHSGLETAPAHEPGSSWPPRAADTSPAAASPVREAGFSGPAPAEPASGRGSEGSGPPPLSPPSGHDAGGSGAQPDSRGAASGPGSYPGAVPSPHGPDTPGARPSPPGRPAPEAFPDSLGGDGQERGVGRRVFIGGVVAAALGGSAFLLLRPDGGMAGPDGGRPDDGVPPSRAAEGRAQGSGTPAPSAVTKAEPFGTEIAEPAALPRGKDGVPTALAAAGGTVVCGTGKGVLFGWDMNGAATRLGDGGEGVTSVAAGTLDGRAVVVSGHEDGRMRLWDASGAKLADHRAKDRIRGVTVAGRAVAMSERHDLVQDQYSLVRLWDVATGEQIGPGITDHFGGVKCLTFGRLDGEDLLVTGDGANRVRLWRLSSGTLLRSFTTGEEGGIELMAYGRVKGAPVLVSTHFDATLRVYDLTTGERIGKWPFSSWSPDDRGVTALAAGLLGDTPIAVAAHAPGGKVTVRVWSLDDGEVIGHLGLRDESAVYHVAIAELDGRPVVAGADERGRLHVWSLGSP